jgi:hypothetical protein
MPSTISAGTSAGTALNITSDTTGNLAFQTNNGVTALTIDTSQNVTFANNVTYTGTITATAGFSGNGAGLTAINASNVSSGTLASARLPTVPVGSGGTGITTTPSNGQIPIGNGTTYAAATLTAGSGISITNGAGSISIATTGGSEAQGGRGQVFTSSGTFTLPTGVTAIKATVVAGGGGGGATSFNGGGGGGGGGGGYAIQFFTGLTPGNTLTVTVGSGGPGNAGSTGSAGGTSSVSSGSQSISTVSASGGSGGQPANQNGGGGAGGGGTSGGAWAISGGSGATGGNWPDQNFSGAGGAAGAANAFRAGVADGTIPGSGPFGGGGGSAIANQGGQGGAGYGSGGGGAYFNSGIGNAAGGGGSAGFVWIEY